mgnify:CR=1 FL=1
MRMRRGKGRGGGCSYHCSYISSHFNRNVNVLNSPKILLLIVVKGHIFFITLAHLSFSLAHVGGVV